MAEQLQIQGHMKKALAGLERVLPVVDGVVEVADARAPSLTRFAPLAKRLTAKHRHLLVLTHADVADAEVAKVSAKALTAPPHPAKVFLWHPSMGAQPMLRAMAITGKTTSRWVVVGLPNVGKSHLINRLAGKKLSKGNKPGVTRGLTWVRTGKGVEILDTPGLLPPRVPTPWHRSLLRTLRVVDEPVNEEDVQVLLREMWPSAQTAVQQWLGVPVAEADDVLEAAKKRFAIREDQGDFSRTATFVWKALDGGKVPFALGLDVAPPPPTDGGPAGEVDAWAG